MSYSAIYLVYRTSVKRVAEFSNAWGSAPPLWDYLWKTRIDSQSSWLAHQEWEELWALVHDRSVPAEQRLCLAWCWDNGIVPLAKVHKMAQACDDVSDFLLANSKYKWNHWRSFGSTLRKCVKQSDKRILGIGLSCTSVADPWIVRRPYTAVWDVFKECAKLPRD
jgi:hypothetical protein